MDNTMPPDTADEVYPCICVDEEDYKDTQFLVDELSCLYENGSIKNIDSEFEKLLSDAEPVIKTPFQMFMFMWYNSNDDLRKELEQMFEIMTAFPFEEFIKEKYDNRLDVVRANENERIFSYRGYEFYIGYSQYQTKGFINFGVAHTKYNKPREYNTRATSTSIDCIRWAITKLAEDVLLEIGIGKRYIGDFVTVIEDQFAKLLNSKYKGVTNYE